MIKGCIKLDFVAANVLLLIFVSFLFLGLSNRVSADLSHDYSFENELEGWSFTDSTTLKRPLLTAMA